MQAHVGTYVSFAAYSPSILLMVGEEQSSDMISQPPWTDPFMATVLWSHVALGSSPDSTTTWLYICRQVLSTLQSSEAFLLGWGHHNPAR